MANATSTLTLSVRPRDYPNGDAESLPELIRQIHEQYGHFRHVTEDDNDTPIATSQEQIEADLGKENEEEVTEDDPETRQKKLQDAKAKMLQSIGAAENDILVAQDFVSLLLRKNWPEQAALTLSRVLKEQLPIGTIGVDKITSTKDEATSDPEKDLVTLGWITESLQDTADSLTGAAKRLSDQAEREGNFWEQILSISEAGWPVCRVAGSRSAIGVRFGFPEASALFQNRALAILTPDSDGFARLPQELVAEPKAIQLRLCSGRTVEQASSTPVLEPLDGPLEKLLRQARDSVFDQELFHLIQQEARDLAGYGVRIDRDEIRLPLHLSPDLPQSRYISITLEPLQETTLPPDSTDSATEIQAIAAALRISLTQTYRARLHRRCQPPRPISDVPVEAPVPQILRPVLIFLDHRMALETLESVGAALQAALERIGVDVSVDHRRYAPSARLEKEDLVLDYIGPHLSRRYHTEWSLFARTKSNDSKDQQAKLNVSIVTSLDGPYYGTVFETEITNGSDVKSPRAMLKEKSEIEKFAQQWLGKIPDIRQKMKDYHHEDE